MALVQPNRWLLSICVSLCLARFAHASELLEVMPLTDQIIMIHFNDGHVIHHQRGQSRSDEKVLTDPLDSVVASSTQTYTITSIEDGRYAQSQHPVQVARKSKGTDFAWFADRWENGHVVNTRPDHTQEHWVYLFLPEAMKRGSTYTVRTGTLASNGSQWRVLFDPAQTRSEAIHVNLLGYVPSAPQKFGYVYHWLGDKGGLDLKAYEGRAFYLIDRSNGQSVFEGKLHFRTSSTQQETFHKSDSPPDGNFLKADVYECDFSSFKQPGKYVLSVAGIGCSFPFALDADIYREPFRVVARGLYHNRSGIALERPWTEFTRPAPHNPKRTPGFADKLIYTTVRFTEWGSEGGDARELLAHSKGPIESAGWYQDAGDWDSYYSHLRVAQELLLAYEMAPKNFTDGELNIPESTNGLPDILDEAAWLPRFCYRLRHELLDKHYGTGGLGLRIAGDAFGEDEKQLPDGRKVGQGSWEDVNRTWAASGEDPWSTYRYAGTAAHLAFCLELARVKDPEGIDWGKEAAQAYAWAQQNTRPGDEQKQPALREPRAYAAAALFRITDDKSYERQFAADTAHIKTSTALWDDQQYGPIVYALAGGKGRPDATLHVRIRTAVLATADILALEVPSKRALRWGGNWYMPMLVGQQTTPWMLQAAAGYVLTRDKDPAKAERYLAALYTTCDYFLGCNALNMTWATGLGPRHPQHVFHMDAWYNGKSQFHPGIIPYGPWRKEKDQGQGPWDASWPFKTVYPAIDAWPANERWFDNRCSPLNSEFTVHQNIAPAAALFGFLCSESAAVPATASRAEPAKVIDLRPLWDTERVLRNPYKGWYHHYYDNGTRNYRLNSDDDLDRFPGMDHLYIRLSWAHFEPEEGRYDWSWIDEVKDRWMSKGYGISLRISTCETGEPHATPEWVIAAGAKGAMFKAYRQEVWVPDYDDPIFLAKLDRFVGQLAKRYDGQPWLRYVDISLGTWGEGHNFPMFNKAIPMEVVKRHIDLYRAHFRRSVLALSDDAVHVHGRTPEEERDLKNYATAKGISWRDDSILTWPGLHNWPDQFNVARPKLFESAWRTFPTVLETSHYHEALRDGAYKATSSGGIRAYEDLRGAIQLTHATYLGYHGDVRKWLSDHPDLAKELANKLGYWYFPKSVATPQRLVAGRENTIQITWENRGTAPAYQRFTLRAQLVGKGGKFILPLEESNNLAWMPGSENTEHYGARIPGGAPAGRYAFSIALVDTSLSPERMIELGLKETLRGPEGFYRLCEIELQGPGAKKQSALPILPIYPLHLPERLSSWCART